MSTLMTPYYADDWLTILAGDCRTVMAEMEPESVQCVITSPPYFGLRDYGIEPSVWGGDLTCEHEWRDVTHYGGGGQPGEKVRWQHVGVGPSGHPKVTSGTCIFGCGAWLGVLGLEPTIELYVAHMVEVFRGVRRVLRKDGTVWLNLGDSYATAGGARAYGSTDGAVGRGDAPGQLRRPPDGLKPKDRMMVPARVALALQADGWWLRDEIVWHKPNPMPSSVTDRTTPAHEMVYLLTKSARYFYDAEAIREDVAPSQVGRVRDDAIGGASWTERGQHSEGGRYKSKKPDGWDTGPGAHGTVHRNGREPGEAAEIEFGRNKRSVARLRRLPRPRCAALRAAHRAGVTRTERRRLACGVGRRPAGIPPASTSAKARGDCEVDPHPSPPVPCTVLDPFGGSGTVGVVAQMHSRRAVLIDLNPDYIAQCLRRNAQSPLGLT